ncbi:MAG TPA: Por secretion system protein [Prevotella sp.]|nr:Por secretion system protein [Prevotella sp.]
MKHRRILVLLLSLLMSLTVSAQRFFNLTSDEVSVDSMLPQFTYTVPLEGAFSDSVYTSTILYPEFIDMTQEDIARYHCLSDDSLPALPRVEQRLVLSRKKGSLEVDFCPLVYRDGRYQILVSFMLRIDAKPLSRSRRQALAAQSTAAAARYAAHSVLATGSWAKIRVPSTGIYQLTDAFIRQAGFSDLSKVKVYGYGGNLQNERLDGDELRETDDLQEVPTYAVGNRRLFRARGPVSWEGNTAARRTRNPYSDYGYYFLTESADEPQVVDSATFVSSFYPSTDDYHTLYEVDGYSWYQGGRNLFDPDPIHFGQVKNVVLKNTTGATTGRLSVSVSAGMSSRAKVSLNGKELGNLYVSLGSYDKGNSSTATYQVNGLTATDTVSISCELGDPIRLDYVSMAWDQPAPAPSLKAQYATPEYLYHITNQDHHADAAADMVIIIPTSQKLLKQAQRLAAFHEQHDSLRVRIVPADELFNEFSSGTPDANAYRRYLKMLYDRAETDADMPRYLLLFGDCVWDNRMRTSECANLNPDDYLLCFESENSFNEIRCFIDDGFFCLLDDGEGVNQLRSDKLDVAVGRFPVTTEEDAKAMVDKTIAYVENKNAGAWQNTLVFMGDDGNGNLHMNDVNDAANDIATRHPGYQVKKVMWDAYQGVPTSTGNTYPAVSTLLKQQQQAGALVMDYGGHGRADQISHERVLTLSDFEAFTNTNLPLWITASCDILPFDGTTPTIGETAVTSSKGGAVAFFGTTRTVYSNYNKSINMAFLRYVLSLSDGKPVTLGEAQRLAKNQMITSRQDTTVNKLQYSLLGDPAISLHLPTLSVVIDSINGAKPSASAPVTLKAGSVARVAGHVESPQAFNGVMTALVRDSRELVTCRLNSSAEATTPFTYYDRTNTLFNGADSVRNGRFAFSFVVPKDINYSDGRGLINIHAVSNDHLLEAHGAEDNFLVGGTDDNELDSLGPKIYCYLNTPQFENGGNVNTTPYFVARLSDDDGINAAGNGIGHDLQLIVDGSPAMTYNLNDYFAYDFGTYQSGSVSYSLPELEPGSHSLLFRAWDVLNNPSAVTLDFNVVKGLRPTLYSVDVSQNPATTSTTFIISHDFNGSNMDVKIDVFDTSGRLLWTHAESGVSTSGAYTVDWDLCQDGGGRLQTGVYLYRVRVSSDGSSEASKAKKLVVINNK